MSPLMFPVDNQEWHTLTGTKTSDKPNPRLINSQGLWTIIKIKKNSNFFAVQKNKKGTPFDV